MPGLLGPFPLFIQHRQGKHHVAQVSRHRAFGTALKFDGFEQGRLGILPTLEAEEALAIHQKKIAEQCRVRGFNLVRRGDQLLELSDPLARARGSFMPAPAR